MQRTFNPLDFGFEWTDGWYRFDHKAAHKAALAARNREAKRLRGMGYAVRCFTHRNQLMSMGGIGSGHPHIQQVVSVYGLNAY